VLILGASGIIGQHMRLCVPDGIEPVWVRRTADPITLGCDLEDVVALDKLLSDHRPHVVVNLAGLECL
jgi:dTDP-4-dehydrorhamnose reductase